MGERTSGGAAAGGMEIREWRVSDAAGLRRLYEDFEPRGAAKGLPPVREDQLRRWLEHLEERGRSLVAVRREDGRIAGHAVLVASGEGEAELAVFVHQQFRGRGLGTALGHAAIEYARRQGYRRLWVAVSPGNAAAVAMVRACGFRTIAGAQGPDLELELELRGGAGEGKAGHIL